jgi:hypothetical protein
MSAVVIMASMVVATSTAVIATSTAIVTHTTTVVTTSATVIAHVSTTVVATSATIIAHVTIVVAIATPFSVVIHVGSGWSSTVVVSHLGGRTLSAIGDASDSATVVATASA